MKSFKPAVALAMVLTGTSAAANTVTFNELAFDRAFIGEPELAVYPSIVSGGFEFNHGCTTSECFGVWARGYNFGDLEGAAVFPVGLGVDEVVMTRTGGGSFDFYSIDLGDVYNYAGTPYGYDTFVTFTFNMVGGASSQQTVALDLVLGLQTVVLDKHQLESVSWGSLTHREGYVVGSVQFDNVVADVTAVPEPGTYALMIAGLAGIGVVARRRQV